MKKSKWQLLLGSLSIFVLGLALTGCPRQAPVEEPVVQEVIDEAPADAFDAAQATFSVGTDWTVVPGLSPVYFDTNQSSLRADARDVLKKNAEILAVVLKEVPGAQVRVEGHCDERGTVEYNLALGQRRADAVRNYYGSYGVARSALKSISYGEEKPICFESGENCWWQNRRGVTLIKSDTPVTVPLNTLPR